MRLPSRHLFLLLLSLSLSLAAQQPSAPAAKPILKAIELNHGDTLVFLGDSITHQCLYTQYLEDYFYTRYPNRRIRFHNAGVGGDTAANALARFDEDVAAFKPKYVTLLLGMNDGRYTKIDHDIFNTYERDMTTLLERLAGIGATAIPMTPTMHDARAARASKRGPQEPRDTYYNGVLAYFGSWLREQAGVRGLGFVDMYSPLNNLTLQERKTDPQFTLIKDAVHPDAPGQVVMAVAILSDMVPRSSVSALTLALQRTGKPGVTAANGKVTDFKKTGEVFQFRFQANALPWVLPAEAAEGFKLTKAGHRYSNEKFTARNLPPGKYELRIDGQLVGTYPDALLARGVELQENSLTPQYQQALKVATLNQERNDQAMRPLRNLWRDAKVKRSELLKLEAGSDKSLLAAKREAFEKWLGTDFKTGTARFQELARQFEEKIYAANQIPVRQYELSPAKN